MVYLIILFLLAAAAMLWLSLALPAQKVARLAVNSGPLMVIGLGGILTVLQRGVIGIPLVLIGLSWLRRNRAARRPPSPSGRTSTVSSVYLEMELDHDTGAMDGTVLTGQLAGARLSTLTKDQLLCLAVEIADDRDSSALLESFLDRYHADWRNHQYDHYQGSPSDAAGGDTMTREEAYQILGLEPGATDEQIDQAWRRLIKAVHPDGGGSAFLATKINAARDLLRG